MECLFLDYLEKNLTYLEINSDERKHLKALRIKENEEIMVSNGKGLMARTKLKFRNNWEPYLEILNYFEEFGEINYNISILVCNLLYRDRLEFIVEKATELGATEVYIAFCQYSQTSKVDIKRLEKKAISALKQSKRSRLLKISLINSKSEIDSLISGFQNVILLDENGDKPLSKYILGDSLILVGPEGGFHQNEITSFEQIPKLIKWYLGKRRLRTETAAIKALSILTSMNE